MADIAGTNLNPLLSHRQLQPQASADVHPAWARLMRYCAGLGHEQVERLKIQNGLPVMADVVREKVKFT